VSHTALVKFAPIFTLERFDDPVWNRAGRTLYERGAFQFLPGKTTVPLLVDHEDSREIGTVHELFRMDWIDGPWIVARATLTAPPSWLKRGARASFGFSAFQRRELNIRGTRADVIAGGIVTEVSVLSPSVKPAEPCAEVLSLRPTESPAAGADRPVAGEVIHHPPGTKLVRPGIGQVLRVS
jgi:hypothetical protein